MLKNFRNGVLAQLMLLAFVGCSMTLHASTTPVLNCTSTIPIVGIQGFVLSSQITNGTCVQVGDKLYGDFNFGNLPPGGLLSFASNSALNRTSVTFQFGFVPGTAYTFGYQVEVINPADAITSVSADVIQSLGGPSSLTATVTPPGTGAINFTKTGQVPSGTNEITFTTAQRVMDLTIVNENFTKGITSDASAVLNSIGQTRVPEPASIVLLGSGMLGLASFRRRRFLKK
jgi:hypothetical protein